jgi:hypothetical protein
MASRSIRHRLNLALNLGKAVNANVRGAVEAKAMDIISRCGPDDSKGVSEVFLFLLEAIYAYVAAHSSDA